MTQEYQNRYFIMPEEKEEILAIHERGRRLSETRKGT
jgi:hypothetical protein